MAQYFLSQDPTISNFGASNTTQDTFVIDTASDSSLTINQVGTNVVVSDGTNTATFSNFTIEQFSSFTNDQQIFNSFDGSNIFIGTATPDVLNENGSATNDYIAGLAGNDTIYGGTGNDAIYGNQGDDLIISGIFVGESTENNTVFGGQGNDEIISFSSGNNIIYGNLGDDNLESAAGNAVIYGGQGADAMESDGAHSTMSGGLGDDLIYAVGSSASSTNLVYGNQGNDQILGFGLKDTVYGGQGNDIVNYDNVANNTVGGPTSGASGALIYGNLGNDIITGSSAGDTLFGGQGDDMIIGNVNGVRNNSGSNVQPTGVVGHDVMTGGLGADTFVQTALTTGNTTATSDVITDFVSGTDKIEGNTAGTQANFTTDLENGQSGATPVTNASQAAAFAAGAATAGANGFGDNYVFVVGKSDGYLVDTDQAGNVGVTTLTGANSITSLKYTDITAGADTVPGGGTVA